MSGKNVEIVAATYECGKNGDFTGFVKDFADDVRWIEMKGSPYAGTFVGAEEIINHVFVPMNAEWEPFACQPQEFFDCGDTVFVVGRYFGKRTDTQKSFDVRVVHCWRIEGEKIVSFEQFTDTRLIAEAMA